MQRRNIRTILCILATAMLLGSCARQRIIPDKTLADIFHDAFLVNAYVGSEHLGTDTLQLYEPIFAKYGYTAEDVRHTIANFSQRKSARLGNVVERAIERLDRESNQLKKQVVILDTIQNVAIRRGTRTVLFDSLIEIRSAKDSVKLQRLIRPVEEGEYTITYTYECDENLDDYPRRANFSFTRLNGTSHGSYSFRLRKRDNIRRSLKADEESTTLVLDLGLFDHTATRSKTKSKDKRGKRTHNLTIRNLKVTYTPSAEKAIEDLFLQYVDGKIFADEFFSATDSLTFVVDSARVD